MNSGQKGDGRETILMSSYGAGQEWSCMVNMVNVRAYMYLRAPLTAVNPSRQYYGYEYLYYILVLNLVAILGILYHQSLTRLVYKKILHIHFYFNRVL